jgi:transposase InsO family protein
MEMAALEASAGLFAACAANPLRRHGPSRLTLCFHLYVILDIFSRYVVGWMIAHREAAEQLVADTIDKQNIVPGTPIAAPACAADTGVQVDPMLADRVRASGTRR